jgi:hypothetical protein
MTTKDLQKEIISTMGNWQQVENSTVALTGQVMEKTKNPIVRLIMEIIQRDSQMHYNVQEWIADSLENKTVSLTPEEIGEVWSLIEKHIEIEKKSVQMAEQAIGALKGKFMVVQTYLLNYLLADEKKHEELLQGLESIKKKMHPYG